MVSCELCGKQLKTAQGLKGHKTFVHGIAGSSTQQPVARLASEQQASILEERLSKLEYITGLREADLDDLLTVTESPLTNKLTTISEQLTKLSDTVSKLSQDVGLSKVTRDADRADLNNRIEEAERKSEDDLNSLAAVVNIHRGSFNSSLAALESRIDKVQKMVEDLGEGLSAVRTKLTTHGHDGLSLIPQLSNRLQQVGEQIAGLQAGVGRAQALTVRTPTDDFERLELANGSRHSFRVYKGKRGLSNPHRVSIDPFFGDKYVDLAEPED